MPVISDMELPKPIVDKKPDMKLIKPASPMAIQEEILIKEAAIKSVQESLTEPIITSKDLDNIATAIGNVEELDKAMKDEQLHELKVFHLIDF